MRGEIVHLELLDLGGVLDLPALDRSLTKRRAGAPPAIGKGTPTYVEFPRPLVEERAPLALWSAAGRREATVSIFYYAIGGASVRFRLPVEAAALAALSPWSQARVEMGNERLTFAQAARRILDEARPGWEPCLRERYSGEYVHEYYTIYALTDVDEPIEGFLERRTAHVAGLLKREDGQRLHEKEIHEATRRWFSYYTDDVTVVDWDSALIADASPEYEDTIFVLEIANLQLLQFRAYDALLDGVLERGYDELGAVFRRPTLWRGPRRTAHDLSLLRMEIAELADLNDNITKFLGDWFLARVHQAAQEKFHLGDWRASVDEKLATLHDLYQVASSESDNRRLLTLEVLIVLLFILDLLLIAIR